MKFTYEPLPGFPPDSEHIKNFGGQSPYSEGFIVKFHNSDGHIWVGNFAKGYTSSSGIYPINDSRFIVIAAGRGYVVDVATQTVDIEFGHGYCDNVHSFSGGIIFSDQISVHKITADGKISSSKRISWDGIMSMVIVENCAMGLSFDVTNPSDPWVPFKLDLVTFELEGGAYDPHAGRD